MSGTPDPGAMTSRVEAAMARIRARLRGEPSTAPASLEPRPSEAANLFPDDLYRSLHQARTIGGAFGVSYTLGWRTPIIGHAWMIVRRRIHQEIRIYIDALTAQQSSLNTHLIRVATRLVETLDALGIPAIVTRQEEQAAEIAALREEVRALRAEISALRSQLRMPDAFPGGNGPASN